jgi:hypothetical protein
VKIYLASRFKTAGTVRGLAEALRAAGHVITSTWHDIEATPAGLVPLDSPDYEAHAKLVAQKDLDQIQAADVFVLLSEECQQTPGGLWFEMGAAYNSMMNCYLLGPKINVFCYLPHVQHFETEAALIEELNFQARFLFRPAPPKPAAVTETHQ